MPNTPTTPAPGVVRDNARTLTSPSPTLAGMSQRKYAHGQHRVLRTWSKLLRQC